MEIELNENDRLFFSWEQSNALRVELHSTEAGESISKVTILKGDKLAAFLASFVQPLLRRALLIAAEHPQKTARH